MPKTGAAEVGSAPGGPVLPADWPVPPGVTAFTTLRHGAGVSPPPFDTFNLGLRSGDAVEAVLRNRERLAALAGLPSPPRWLRQVHGVAVRRFGAGPHPGPLPQAGEGVGSPEGKSMPEPAGTAVLPLPLAGEGRGEGALRSADHDAPPEPEADASVTSDPRVVLAVLTADCLPVVFAARDGSEVAAAHAGWRGLAAGVLERTVAAMRTPPAGLQAWLGPAAGPQAYEVGAEVYAAFVDRDPGAVDAFAATRPGHWRVDLYALARRRLTAAGIAAAEIHGGGLCTISDPRRFYSHRRDAHTGRMATLVYRSAGTD